MCTGIGIRCRIRSLNQEVSSIFTIVIDVNIRLAATKALKARRVRNRSRHGTRQGSVAAVSLGKARRAWRVGSEASCTWATAVISIALAAELLSVASIAGAA